MDWTVWARTWFLLVHVLAANCVAPDSTYPHKYVNSWPMPSQRTVKCANGADMARVIKLAESRYIVGTPSHLRTHRSFRPVELL